MACGGPWHLPNSVAALNTHAALLGMGFPPGPGFLLPGYGEFYGGIYNSYGEGFQNPYIPDPAAFLGAPFPAPSLGAPAFPQPPATQAKPSSSCKPVVTKLKPNPVVDSQKKTKAAESGTVIDTSVPASEKRAKSKQKNKGPAGQAAKTHSVWVPVESGGTEVLSAPKSGGPKPAPHNRRSKAVTPDKLPMAPSEWVGQSSVARETLPLKPAAAKQPSGIAIERPISFDGAPGTEPVCPITLVRAFQSCCWVWGMDRVPACSGAVLCWQSERPLSLLLTDQSAFCPQDFMQDPVVAQDGYTYEVGPIPLVVAAPERGTANLAVVLG